MEFITYMLISQSELSEVSCMSDCQSSIERMSIADSLLMQTGN